MPSTPKKTPPKKPKDGWYKKSGKKRKAESPLQNKGKSKGVQGARELSDAGVDQCTAHGLGEQSVSSILSATNEILYGELCVTDTTDNMSMYDNASDATETNRKLDIILDKLRALDKIEEKLVRLDASVIQLEQRVTGMEKKTDDFEKSVNFMSGQIDEFKESCKKIQAISEDVVKHNRSIKMLCDTVDKARDERDEIRDTVLDLQCRSMKNNLVFSGLAGESYDEDTEGKIRDFLNNELGIEDVDRVAIANVHRFGKYIQGRCRPIVAKFVYLKDVQRIKYSAYKLKGKPYGINEQFPRAIEERRKKLYPVMKKLKEEGKKPNLVRDKIFVQGKRFDNVIDIDQFLSRRNAPRNTSNTTSKMHTTQINSESHTPAVPVRDPTVTVRDPIAKSDSDTANKSRTLADVVAQMPSPSTVQSKA